MLSDDELDDDRSVVDSGRPIKANADAVDERLQAANATSSGLGRNFILLQDCRWTKQYLG
jgi:hypothetical protein